jgi:large subunit ribosomal protein L29
MKENADKARALDATELAKQLRDGSEQMFRLRFQLRMGQADGLKKLRSLRKERARMLTVQRERELGKAEAPAPSATKKAPAAKAKKAAPVRAAAPKAEKAAKAPKAAAKPAAKKKTAKEQK